MQRNRTGPLRSTTGPLRSRRRFSINRSCRASLGTMSLRSHDTAITQVQHPSAECRRKRQRRVGDVSHPERRPARRFRSSPSRMPKAQRPRLVWESAHHALLAPARTPRHPPAWTVARKLSILSNLLAHSALSGPPTQLTRDTLGTANAGGVALIPHLLAGRSWGTRASARAACSPARLYHSHAAAVPA